MENLLPIGQFAAASRLSLKALRLYDENRLLPPAWIDPDSGYRYYSLAQLQQARLIGLLRSAGMPLAEIRSFLADPAEARLDEYEAALDAELTDRRAVLDYVRRTLKEAPMFEVATKQVDAQSYVSRSKHVRVRELEPFIVQTIGELAAGGSTGVPFTLFHGEVNETADGPVEVCVPRADGEKTLPAGEVAFTVVEGSQCDFPEILGAYDTVARWTKEHGRELDGSCREIYLSRLEKGETPRMEIAFPLR
jgi:DNA-binding transcriptional MerR regulator